MNSYFEGHDKPNLVYSLIGQQIWRLAEIGATDRELKRIFKKGPECTLKDLAEVEVRHYHTRPIGTLTVGRCEEDG